jgi:hypothetical protein
LSSKHQSSGYHRTDASVSGDGKERCTGGVEQHVHQFGEQWSALAIQPDGQGKLGSGIENDHFGLIEFG